MKPYPKIFLLLLLFFSNASAEMINGTWEGFVISSAGTAAYTRLHLDNMGGYLLRSVPFGSASAQLITFKESDIAIQDGIIRITAREQASPSANAYTESIIIFSLRKSVQKESRYSSSAIGSTFEYLISNQQGRIPFNTGSFELQEIRSKSFIDDIKEKADNYRKKHKR